ncbi:MAG TPA: FAD-dependent oxidoreductase [Sedimentisphaerales bacterium]|jgi:thioredoxin reductase (NADPH)|nr:FAD-dependent oxidoreductase [Sedimentisphaerales bacterium]HNU29269.1 FAD-dependent oxidoreductase [Sedimentisphaerales bacterium]
MADTQYDVIIVGGGPAGLGAALYSSRDRYRTVILEKMIPGGQIFNTDRIENYPGIARIDGPTLIDQMQKQVESFGTEIKTASEVTDIKRTADGRIEVYCGKDRYVARAVILAPGSGYRKLGVPGEDEFRNAGAGVSYCGTCDGPFFRDKEVVSVGGGNSALEETLHLTKYARKVTIIHRRNEFRADKILVEELLAKAAEPKSPLVIRYDSVVTAIQGAGRVQSVRLKNVKTGAEEDYPCDGAFIFVGMVPNTEFLKGIVDLTDQGFIRCDSTTLRTSVPGIFVAGDCRVGATMQLITAVADGVNTAMMIKQYFRDPQWWKKTNADVGQVLGW